MTLERILPVLVVLMTALAVISAAILVRAALQRPWIGALIERAGIGAIIAAFGVTSALLVLNTETGRQLIDMEAARVLFRVSLLALLAVPTFWDYLYYSGRLGGDEGLTEAQAAAMLRARGWTVIEGGQAA